MTSRSCLSARISQKNPLSIDTFLVIDMAFRQCFFDTPEVGKIIPPNHLQFFKLYVFPGN